MPARWTKLKKRVEDRFADSVKGRLELRMTRYRHAHDGEGEAWITFDRQKIATMSTFAWFHARYAESRRLTPERGFVSSWDHYLRCRERRQWEPYEPDSNYSPRRIQFEADDNMHAQGIFGAFDLVYSMADYLNHDIDDALRSDNHIIRALALVDRRFGKRRLLRFDPTDQPSLVRAFYSLRCQAEGLHPDAGAARAA